MFSLNSLVRLLAVLIILPILSKLHKRAFAKKQRKAQVKAAEEHRYGKQPKDNVQQQSTRLDRQTSVDSITTLGSSDQTNVTAEAAPVPVTELDPVVPIAPASPVALTVRTKAEMFSDIKFNTWMVRLGFAISSVTYIGYGLASNGWVFCMATVLHAFCIVASPPLKTLFTTMVEPSQFGAILGAMTVVDSVASVTSPIAISWVYAYTVKFMPEFVWYSLAFWGAVCVVLSFMIRQKQFRSTVSA